MGKLSQLSTLQNSTGRGDHDEAVEVDGKWENPSPIQKKEKKKGKNLQFAIGA
jgi:hypothetical protein